VIQRLTPELVEKANTGNGTYDGRAFGLVGHYKSVTKKNITQR